MSRYLQQIQLRQQKRHHHQEHRQRQWRDFFEGALLGILLSAITFAIFTLGVLIDA